MTIAELVERAGGSSVTTNSNALFDRLAEARLAGAGLDRGLFAAVRDAALRFGPSKPIIEDIVTGALSYRRMLIGARVLGRRFAAITEPGEAVGVLLPNTNGVVLTLLGLASGERVAAMMNYTAGPANVAAAVRAAAIRTVVSSRAFVEKAATRRRDRGDREGRREDAVAGGRARQRRHPGKALGRPAVALAAGPAGRRQARHDPVHLGLGRHAQGGGAVAAATSSPTPCRPRRASRSRRPTRLLNVLPVFHSFGLTGGTILPLINGVPLFLYPSPLHYKIIPEIARKVRPTVMFGTDTFLSAYARTAKEGDFSSLRFVVAGAEAVKPETRRIWRERFGAEIVEGFGLTEASPVVAVNTATHGRDGSVGRLLPGHADAARPGRRHNRGRPAVAVGAEPDARLHDRRAARRAAAARRGVARHRRHRRRSTARASSPYAGAPSVSPRSPAR